MPNLFARSLGTLLLLCSLLGACNKLGLGSQPEQSKDLPTREQLRSIAYMSQAKGPDGRQAFDRLGEAKSCHDFEIAMRWNRPPDVRGGPFNQKMVYITSHVPADLPKDSEVFLLGAIEQGQTLPSGGSVWAVRLKDGSEVQAVETAGYAEKQEEAQQNGGSATMVHPFTPGRALCAYGVYQGVSGLSLNRKQRVPLVSVLFAMDRRR